MDALSFLVLMGSNLEIAPSLFQAQLCSQSPFYALVGGVFPHTQGNGQSKKPSTCAKARFPESGIRIPIEFRESIGEDVNEVTQKLRRSDPLPLLA